MNFMDVIKINNSVGMRLKVKIILKFKIEWNYILKDAKNYKWQMDSQLSVQRSPVFALFLC